jgi:hypothetical protein
VSAPGVRLGPGRVPCARVVRSTAQLIAPATFTPVAFESETWDTDDLHGSAVDDSRLTARTAGLYVITASLEWEASPVGWRTASLRLSDEVNAAFDQRLAVRGAATVQAITAQWLMGAGDWVRLVVLQSSGLPLELGGGSHVETSLAMTWLAPPAVSGSRAP